ncbi:tRNA ligase [Tilletia horrida]|uniref:tRNA ligase n=1 Tax=Tilletia horrida TaxID=155126 RepID=A0AAN6GGC6_9BASI|nr:tRNA ligase [Tilletia horrida]
MADTLVDRLAAASLSAEPARADAAPGAAQVDAAATAKKTPTELVRALQRASDSGPKAKRLIRSTTHYVARTTGVKDAGAVDISAEANPYALVSWKTAEFAYRKSAGLSSELPTLARGLFTEQVGEDEHRIVVRGYDKFFNVGELPWTKPQAIKCFSTPPYHLTFKENGCIIFIAALSPTQLVVTSKHSLGAREDVEMSHAVKGEEWLVRHLGSKGKRTSDLAAELWRRNETAVCELCDDLFEEHVIAYTPENSGLHLHGLNANQAKFETRPMAEVDTFARKWGFIPTRWLEINSMAEVDKLTEEISRTGSWKGEAIEGFVVRTHMPADLQGILANTQTDQETRVARPPYEAGQEWFYKIKFDEPYLMYRDWRELTRRLLREKKDWETKTKSLPAGPPSTAAPVTPATAPAAPPQPDQPSQDEAAVPDDPDVPKKSKNQLKKERKAAHQEKQKAEAIAAQAASRAKQPTTNRAPRPVLRFKRPKTMLYIEWAYNLLWGSEDGKVKPQPHMFEKFNQGKGIIALREAFLAYLRTPDGGTRLRELGGTLDDDDEEEAGKSGRRKFDKTVIVPIGVPGCGKTSLFVALREIFQWGHTQSDDVQTKRTGPQFLANIEKELAKHDVVIADRNNHLFKHRDEIVGVVEKVKAQGKGVGAAGGDGKAEKGSKGQKQQGKGGKGKDSKAASAPAGGAPSTAATTTKPAALRIRLIALTWSFDSHALNEVHRICSQRIMQRGDNHQSLRVEGSSSTASSTSNNKRAKLPHELILWNFLEELQPFGSSLGGEGDEGQADEVFDATIRLEVEYDQERALRVAISQLAPLLDLTQPSEEQIRNGLAAARGYKVAVRKEMNLSGARGGGGGKAKAKTRQPRYYALRVDASPLDVVPALIAQCPDPALRADAQRVFDQLRAAGRLVAHPHITLVHSKSVEAETSGAKADGDGDGLGAKKRWEAYERLCKEHGSFQLDADGDNEDEDADADQEQDEVATAAAAATPAHPLAFTFTINKLVWNDRVMALGVRDVTSASLPNFAQLQGGGRGGAQQGKWRPHITVGTAREEIRPYEANEALRLAEDEGKGKMIDAGEGGGGVQASGRLQGMWS